MSKISVTLESLRGFVQALRIVREGPRRDPIGVSSTECCVLCGTPIKGGRQHRMAFLEGVSLAVPLQDTHAFLSDPAFMGMRPIGRECARQLFHACRRVGLSITPYLENAE